MPLNRETAGQIAEQAQKPLAVPVRPVAHPTPPGAGVYPAHLTHLNEGQFLKPLASPVKPVASPAPPQAVPVPPTATPVPQAKPVAPTAEPAMPSPETNLARVLSGPAPAPQMGKFVSSSPSKSRPMKPVAPAAPPGSPDYPMNDRPAAPAAGEAPPLPKSDAQPPLLFAAVKDLAAVIEKMGNQEKGPTRGRGAPAQRQQAAGMSVWTAPPEGFAGGASPSMDVSNVSGAGGASSRQGYGSRPGQGRYQQPESDTGVPR